MNRNEIRKNRGYTALRRDWRNDLSTPEVPKGHPKRKQKKLRKRIDHKHVWVKDTRLRYPAWWPYRLKHEEDTRPQQHFAFICSVPGCAKRKHVQNMRYGYEFYKWCKNNGLSYRAFTTRGLHRGHETAPRASDQTSKK